MVRAGSRIAIALACLFLAAPAANAQGRHAIAMHGEPAWPADFTAPTYSNPNAPKGGRLVQGVFGSFDTLNPFTTKGLVVQGVRSPFTSNFNVINGYVVESLMARSFQEPFTLYGLLAQTVETNDARDYVTFTLNPAAHFSDGKPVTAEDVVFTWQLLRDKGRPNHRLFYSKVKKAEIVGERSVRFDLTGANDRELPLIMGLMSVLPKHAINPDTFEETTFKPLTGSGPYVVADVDPGRSVTFRRDPNYWGRDLPLNRGLWNFDELRFDFYRDTNAHLEAFKAALYDIRTETDPSKWQGAYDSPALQAGRYVQETFPTGMPKSMVAYVFNTRRPIFQNIRVREALLTLLDFEWINKNVFHGLHRRTASFYEGSELSFRGRPADARERTLLAPFPDAVRPEILDGSWSPPVTDGSGRDRDTLRRALTLLGEAGYELRGTELVHKQSGQPFAFEFLALNRDDEKNALLFASQLKRAGISMNVRLIDAVQYEARRIAFDFDMIQNRWDQSLSPGNEQAFYWSSAAADHNGSRNYMGMKSAAADAMIAALLAAKDRKEVIAAVRALDRVLMSGFYVIPLSHAPGQWLARWTHIHRPEQISTYGYLPETWWQGAPK